MNNAKIKKCDWFCEDCLSLLTSLHFMFIVVAISLCTSVSFSVSIRGNAASTNPATRNWMLLVMDVLILNEEEG